MRSEVWWIGLAWSDVNKLGYLCNFFFWHSAACLLALQWRYITASSHLLLFLLLNMRLGFWSEKLTLFLYCPCFMGILKVLGTQGFLLSVACNVCWRTIPRKTHFHLRWITFSVVVRVNSLPTQNRFISRNPKGSGEIFPFYESANVESSLTNYANKSSLVQPRASIKPLQFLLFFCFFSSIPAGSSGHAAALSSPWTLNRADQGGACGAGVNSCRESCCGCKPHECAAWADRIRRGREAWEATMLSAAPRAHIKGSAEVGVEGRRREEERKRASEGWAKLFKGLSD